MNKLNAKLSETLDCLNVSVWGWAQSSATDLPFTHRTMFGEIIIISVEHFKVSIHILMH